jgi:hypothetical protein
MIENRKNIQDKVQNEKSRIMHLLALIYVENPSRKTCRDYQERRATYYTDLMYLLPDNMADLILISKQQVSNPPPGKLQLYLGGS